MRPSEYSEIKDEYDYFSRSIQIAIYGYYDMQNRIELRKLKRFLIENNLNAKMAEDFDNIQIPVSYQHDAITCSTMLYDSSTIHIYVVTLPIEIERNKLLDSLSMEYGWAWKDKQEYVGLYFKKNYDISTLPIGAIQAMNGKWNPENFDKIEEIFSIVLSYCEHSIRELFRFSDNL